jgi:hypothetical protein
MRSLLILSLFLIAIAARAQGTRPAGLEPVPEPAPPPPALPEDTVDEPEVTIRQQGEDSYEEYRLNGQLYMIRVMPKGGVPYYLIDPGGTGTFARQEGLGADTRPPMWVIKRF